MTRAHFVTELDLVHQNLISMGELTLKSVAHCLDCLGKTEGATYEQATELESKIDDMSRTVHDQALAILVLQSPVARDARLITGILGSVVDLEQIADYAYEISDLAFQTNRRPTAQVLSQVASIGKKVNEMLGSALDSWKHLDRALGLSVRTAEESIRNDCRVLTEKLYQLSSAPADAQVYVNLILICKHFERMARHIFYVADNATSAAPSSNISASS